MGRIEKMNISISNKILKILKKHYGSTEPDLSFKNLYELVVSVVLSAQTTDKQVNSVTPLLFKKYPDFKSLSLAEISDVEKIIKRVGFFRVKSKHIINLSKKITTEFSNTVPDTHVMRISNRLGYTEYTGKKDPDKTESALIKIIPEKDWIAAHLLFIRHGRDICKAAKPLCNICPVEKLCPGRKNFL